MSEPIGQHFLPKCYLKNFSDSSRIWIFDSKNKKIFNSKIDNIFRQNHFYTICNEDGSKDYSVERFLSGIEGKATSTIKKLIKITPINWFDKYFLALFVSLQAIRTPMFELKCNEIEERIQKEELRSIFCSISKTVEYMNKKGIQNVDSKRFFEFIQKSDFKISFHRNNSIISMLELWHSICDVLLTYDWEFYYSDKAAEFVSCDNPFVIINRFKTDPHKIGYPNAIHLMPLTKHICLRMLQKGKKIFRGNLNSCDVDMFNTDIAKNSQRFVFASNNETLQNALKNGGWDMSEIEIVDKRKFHK